MHWGIDLGGTKIEGVVLESIRPLRIRIRQRIPTDRRLGYDHIIDRIGLLVDQIAVKVGHRPASIGIATPGQIDRQQGTLKNSNTTCLNGRPLQADLEQALGIPVRMANDANCFALAEALYGAVPHVHSEARIVFGVILGTGVGGGLVVNNEVLVGRHGITGEWGHNYLDHSGGPCYCGKVGCVERILSGPALEGYYEAQTRSLKSLAGIVEAYRSGRDEAAEKTMHRLFDMFGRGMAGVINIVDPDVVVLGGGLSLIDELYTLGVRKVEKYIFNHTLNTIFLKAHLGDSAGVIGAALL